MRTSREGVRSMRNRELQSVWCNRRISLLHLLECNRERIKVVLTNLQRFYRQYDLLDLYSRSRRTTKLQTEGRCCRLKSR